MFIIKMRQVFLQNLDVVLAKKFFFYSWKVSWTKPSREAFKAEKKSLSSFVSSDAVMEFISLRGFFDRKLIMT